MEESEANIPSPSVLVQFLESSDDTWHSEAFSDVVSLKNWQKVHN